jgi:hypothetical protein
MRTQALARALARRTQERQENHDASKQATGSSYSATRKTLDRMIEKSFCASTRSTASTFMNPRSMRPTRAQRRLRRSFPVGVDVRAISRQDLSNTSPTFTTTVARHSHMSALCAPFSAFLVRRSLLHLEFFVSPRARS